MSKNEPLISIVMVIGNRRRRSSRALESLLAQAGISQAEIIILVDRADRGYEQLPESDHNNVRTLRRWPPADYGSLKAEGVLAARGELVAVLEDHITVQPGWLQAVVSAFDGPWTAVGFRVENGNSGLGLSDLMHSINYGGWGSSSQSGERDMVAGNNTAFKRTALVEHRDELGNLLLSDAVLQMLLREEGKRLYFESAAAIRHLNETTSWDAIRAEFSYHWCFGAARSAAFDWGWGKKGLYLLATPLLPWRRILSHFESAREHGSVLELRHLPLIILLLHVMIWGQNLGLVFGPRIGACLFTEFELSSARPRT